MNKKEVSTFIKTQFPSDFCNLHTFDNEQFVLEKWLSFILQGYNEFHRKKFDVQKSIVQNIKNQDLSYIPKTQYNHIIRTTFQRFSCSFQLKKPVLRSFHVHLYYGLGNKPSQTFITKQFEKIFVWFHFVSRFSSGECSKTVNLHLYNIDENKVFPKHGEPIDSLHANSAFTTSCMPETSIYIYRIEEWYKVLMHESFHNFGLDFSQLDEHYGKQAVLSLFPHVETESIRIYESYCETWATFFNAFLVSFFSTQKKENMSLILKKTKSMMCDECIFSIMQTVRILNHYGFTYASFIRDFISSKKMIEHTNVFSYYILKSILLCQFDQFFVWSKKNNESIIVFRKNYKTVEEYIQLIARLYNKHEFQMKIKQVEKMKNSPLKNTLRMTFHG